MSFFKKNFYIYLFIWLSQVLVVACGIFITMCGIFVLAHRIFFSCSTWDLCCGMWDLLVVAHWIFTAACGLLVVAYELLVAACGIWFLDQGLNPGLLHWEHGVLTTGSPGKFWGCLFFRTELYELFVHFRN